MCLCFRRVALRDAGPEPGRFRYIRVPKNLRAQDVKRLYAGLRVRGHRLKTVEDWLGYIDHWDEIKAYFKSERSRRYFAASQDTRDTHAARRQTWFCEIVTPLTTRFDAQVRRRVLHSPLQSELAARVGTQLFAVWEANDLADHPLNIPEVTRIDELFYEYDFARSQSEFDFAGTRIGHIQVQNMLLHPNETTRQLAFELRARWLTEQREKLDDIYDQMVGLRHAMARKLDLPNYIPLGYATLQRLDYGPRQVALFRKEIQKHVVPLLARLRAKQAKELGASSVKPWNRSFFPDVALPPDMVPVETQMEKLQSVFSRLHPTLGAHFKRLHAENLVDIENRPGKSPELFCEDFPDENLARLFCNSTGMAENVLDLTHECGHAFQSLESFSIPHVELQNPSYEACEIPSVSMEFMTLDHLNVFFNQADAEKFRRDRLMQAITGLAYGCVVDEFQHHVYEHPKWTPDKRAEAWVQVWKKYLVGEDWTHYENTQAHWWQYQGHIYGNPFYYIDYAMAEICALQLWLIQRKNPARAMKIYLQLCRLGGTKPFLELLNTVGLQSPFKPGVLAKLMRVLQKELDL